MWELPSDLPGATEHELVVLFEGPDGVSEQFGSTSTQVRGGCRCGWRAARTFGMPSMRPATDQRASNLAEIEAHLQSLREEHLRPDWWREHLLEAVPLLELRQTTPAARIADPTLADAVASAWVAGASWTDIGEAVGIARQAAWKRWRHTVQAGPPRTAAPGTDGRQRNTSIPAPAGWPGRPGWAHPAPDHASEHSPLSYSVDLSGREHDNVRATAAYLGPGCTCGWRGHSAPMPDVPRAQLREAIGQLADHALATAWNRHLHQALPTLRIKNSLQHAQEGADELGGLVARAHSRGASWSEIGRELGMSAQGAWERWHSVTPATGEATAATRRSRTLVLRNQARA